VEKIQLWIKSDQKVWHLALRQVGFIVDGELKQYLKALLTATRSATTPAERLVPAKGAPQWTKYVGVFAVN
jgi:hypothetical protein